MQHVHTEFFVPFVLFNEGHTGQGQKVQNISFTFINRKPGLGFWLARVLFNSVKS